jgi:hypothetical protein
LAASGKGAATGYPAAGYVATFREGFGETGYVDGRVTVEYHWLEGQYDRLPLFWLI